MSRTSNCKHNDSSCPDDPEANGPDRGNTKQNAYQIPSKKHSLHKVPKTRSRASLYSKSGSQDSDYVRLERSWARSIGTIVSKAIWIAIANIKKQLSTGLAVGGSKFQKSQVIKHVQV